MDSEASLPEAIAQPGHNRLQAVLENATFLGGQSALGVTALLQLGMTVIDAAHDEIIKPENATLIAKRYADGCKNAGGTPGSVKTNASKLRKLIEFSKLNDGLKLANDALRVRGTLKTKKSPFETLVEVARHCLKSKSCELADDEVAIVITKAPPKEKSKAKAKTKTSDWQSVAIQVFELIEVKNEDGIRAAYAIRAQLDNYLRDDNEGIHGAEACVMMQGIPPCINETGPALPHTDPLQKGTSNGE